MIGSRHAAREPERLVAGKGQQLRDLRVVPERIDQPAGCHIDAELLAIISLSILYLPDEGLTTGHVHVGHDVQAADQLQPALGQKRAEVALLVRVSFQERFHVSHLVKDEPVIGLLLQELHRLQNTGQSHLQVFRAGLEDGPLPVGVGNDPEGALQRLVRGIRRRRRAMIPGAG